MLVVLEFAGLAKSRDYTYKCQCDCGRIAIVKGTFMRHGQTKSCGCRRWTGHPRHGDAKKAQRSPEYTAWCHMKKRCSVETDPAFPNYGGRGISVCSEWTASYEQFLKDVGRRPSSVHSLDRIDVNGNYEPSNVRWATKAVQGTNKRKIRDLEVTIVLLKQQVSELQGQLREREA